MKFFSVFVVIVTVLAVFLGTGEARPGKIPINAIRKGAKAVVSKKFNTKFIL